MYAGLRSGYNYGFKVNFNEARKWLNKSIQNGFEIAAEDRDKITDIEEIYTKKVQEQIEELLKKKKLRRKDFEKIDKIIEEYKESGCEVKLDKRILDEIGKRRQ